MCIRPNQLQDGVLVACRECWQCIETRVDDWVGRCIAESRTALACHSITLTYGGGDHERAAVLTYSDVQKYFKVLRRRGYPCRYFAVGEYGSKKGRSHWHLIVYWLDRVPPHELGVRFDEYHWAEFAKNGKRLRSRGWSHWEKPGREIYESTAAIRYVCKYVYKDQMDAEAQGFLSMSKKPPLGDAYFRELAGRYVAHGLSPQDFFYSFPEVKRDGKKIRFCMHGKTAENFIASFCDQWSERRDGILHGAGGLRFTAPNSPLVQDFIDKFRFCSVRQKWVPWDKALAGLDARAEQVQRSNDAMITVRWLDPTSSECLRNRDKWPDAAEERNQRPR